MDQKPKKLPIGIDLGTTNSAVAAWWNDRCELVENQEGTRINPSYVYYLEKEQKIGRMARDKGSIDPKHVLFDAKRLLATNVNDKNVVEFKNSWPFTVSNKKDDPLKKTFYKIPDDLYVPPENVSSCILKSLLKDVCRRFDKRTEDIEAVITVPAYFNISQKRATIAAAEKAGLTVIQLLSEPVAGAICYQHEMNFKDGEIIFTFDLGGGTFDVTIMEITEKLFRVIALGGDSHLGGRDFDMKVVEEMKNRLKKQLGKEVVENLDPNKKFKMIDWARETKEALSVAEKDCLNLSDIHHDAAEEYITREEFEKKSEKLKNKIRESCLKTIEDAKLNCDKINHIVLVGGSSKMCLVKEIVAEIFGKDKKISKTVSADESIAKGAAMYAAKLLNATNDPKIQDLRIQDALPLSIGVEVPGDKFEPVLEHNSPIPSSNSITLTTSQRNQKAAKIPIYEGLHSSIADNTYLGELEVTGLPPGQAGSVSVKIVFSLDMNGILEAKAEVVGIGTVVSTTIEYETRFETTGDNSQRLPVGGETSDERRGQLPP